MAKVSFTANSQRHVACPPCEVPGRTVREVLDAVFADNPPARGYVLDDQGALRKHMSIFDDGRLISDRNKLSRMLFFSTFAVSSLHKYKTHYGN